MSPKKQDKKSPEVAGLAVVASIIAHLATLGEVVTFKKVERWSGQTDPASGVVILADGTDVPLQISVPSGGRPSERWRVEVGGRENADHVRIRTAYQRAVADPVRFDLQAIALAILELTKEARLEAIARREAREVRELLPGDSHLEVDTNGRGQITIALPTHLIVTKEQAAVMARAARECGLGEPEEA